MEKIVTDHFYKGSFEITADQLRRIVDIIEVNFESAGFKSDIDFKLGSAKKKSVSFEEIEKVFAYTNNKTEPLLSLEVEAVGYTQHEERIRTNNNIRCGIKYRNYIGENGVTLDIRGEDRRWVNQITNELEQEIQETLCTDLGSKIAAKWNLETALLSIIGIGIIVLIGMATYAFVSENSVKTKEIDRQTEQLIQSIDTLKLPEEKIDFLFRLRVLEIQREAAVKLSLGSLTQILNPQFGVKLLIFLCLLAIAAYVLKNYYPSNNFIWGDYEKYYKSLVDKRNFYWGTVIVGFVISVFASLVLI